MGVGLRLGPGMGFGGGVGSDPHPEMCTCPRGLWLVIKLEGQKIRHRFSMRTLPSESDKQRSISQLLVSSHRGG